MQEKKEVAMGEAENAGEEGSHLKKCGGGGGRRTFFAS